MELLINNMCHQQIIFVMNKYRDYELYFVYKMKVVI